MPNLFFQDGELIMDAADDALAVDSGCCCDGVDVCTDCCTGFSLVDDVVVDLGNPGLSNDINCFDNDPDCTDIDGEYTVAYVSTCFWQGVFYEDTFCGWGSSGNPQMNLNLWLITEGGDCFWRLHLRTSVFGLLGVVIYESTPKTFVENDCTLASAVTLNHVSTDWDSMCSGTMPSTITIEAAP